MLRVRLHQVNFFLSTVLLLPVPSYVDNAFPLVVCDCRRNKSRAGSSAGLFPNYSAEQEELGAARTNPGINRRDLWRGIFRGSRNARDGRWKIWKCGSRMRSRGERLNKRTRVRSVSIFERKILNRDGRILYYTHVWFWNCINIFILSFFNFRELDVAVVKRSIIKGILYKRIQENQFIIDYF